MDRMAIEGFDVWCLDLLGYGRSERPEQLRAHPEANPPIVDTQHAVAEVERAVDFICAHREINRVNLIGYSWGTVTCGTFAGSHPERVERLVLSGALWIEKGGKLGAIAATPGAYRSLDAAALLSRWSVGMDEETMAQIVSLEVRQQWCEDTVMSDEEATCFDPPRMKAPSGVIKDFQKYAASGEPWYTPEKITAPTLVVVGEFDQETTPKQSMEVFSRLTRASEKRLTIIGNGTHALLMEENRKELGRVVSSFLRGQ